MMMAKNNANGMFALTKIVQDGMRGHPDQRTAIVVGNDFNPRRQAAVSVEPFDLGLNARDDIIGMLGPPHHHDRGRDIVIMVPAPDAKPWHIADGYGRDILDLDRKTVRLGQDDVFDVLDFVTLGDVVGAPAVDQSNTADIDGLLPDRDFAAAHIDVGIAERGDELGDRNIVGFELSEIGVDVELLGGAAPAVDLHHAGNGEKTPGDDIILQCPQIGQPEMRRTDNLIAVDLTDQAGLLDLRDLVARQVDVLLQADRRLRQGEIEIDPIFEGNADKRQAVE
jgi:hypothetical protein